MGRDDWNFSTMLDDWIVLFDQGLRTCLGVSTSIRENPAQSVEDDILNEEERKQSAALIRVDHAGEIAAQGLYYGQALVARDPSIKNHLLEAAQEENDHLSWCNERLHELQSHCSIFSPLWYVGSVLIGAFAGCFNDRNSLGFVVETEKQVEQHLENHLMQLPVNDHKSRSIIKQMQEDEIAHGQHASALGAEPLPFFIKKVMNLMSKIMVKTATYF